MGQLVEQSVLQKRTTGDRLETVLTAATSTRPDERVIDGLINSMAFDPSVNVRLNALNALYSHADQEVVRAGVLACLPRETNPLVQVSMIDFLVAAKAREASRAPEAEPRRQGGRRRPRLGAPGDRPALTPSNGKEPEFMKSHLAPFPLLLAAALALVPLATARADESISHLAFSDPSKPGTLKIRVWHGDVTIRGADVKRHRRQVGFNGRAPNPAQGRDARALDLVELRPIRKGQRRHAGIRLRGLVGGSADFEITVPRSTSVVVSNSAHGDLECSGSRGTSMCAR
jgi:hypothetical protein